MHIKRDIFIWDYIKKDTVPYCFEELHIDAKKIYTKNRLSEFNNNSPLIIHITLFPNFIQSKIFNTEDYICKKINHRNFDGAGILIKEGYSIDNYLNTFYKQKFRANIKRYIRHLERAFDIKYETNFGNISLEKFNFLIDNLYIMLKKRFEQKNKHNHFIENWENNIENLYALINKKKASLFVIYDNEKPINISISYHNVAGIQFSVSTGYDINYSKFGLGHISNYKKLEWCLNNSYTFLDLGNGISKIKKEWCNKTYDFEYHVYYKKQSALAFIIAHNELLKIKLKNLIKDIKNKAIVNIPEKKQLKPSFSLHKLNPDNNYKKDNHTEIDINNNEFEFLRYPIYNYLFSYNEHINNITIYKIENELNTYLIKGKKISKLILNN